MHAEKPELTAMIHANYRSLAACTKEQVQLQDWYWGDSVPVYIIDSTTRPLMRLYSIYGDTPIFELTFQPTEPDMTHVEFRSIRKSQRTQREVWPIIERCVSQLSAAPAHDMKER
jgi:hypothetical protein